MSETIGMQEDPKSERKKIFLRNYEPPDYRIEKIDLTFQLNPHATQVTSRSHVVRRTTTSSSSSTLGTPLILHGKALKLLDVKINGEIPRYESSEDGLTLFEVPEKFELLIQTEIAPESNKSCEGLYQSKGNYCTQCEAEGFRRMTYYIDRPDNMAIFSTTIIADKKECPVLLSNGNLVESKDYGEGKHMARWVDPHKKPSYLFALVAGNLDFLQDTFTTKSGRQVDLRIYTELGRTSKCHHAMTSLKKSMKWDEDRYGLEYDLDRFMIVAVDDFNAGAMENKGLNIFNAKYILADPQTATDQDYENIESIVGHEYFHNWTGNRVTCRDWFQLSLKEGLTVYRDQEFSSDMGSRPVKRIEDVSILRAHQFQEDGGPNAHPVRPQSCYSVSNFYTLTVYRKGAEVIRMMESFVGRKGFRKGMDKYFELFDGQAVTIEDFVSAMEQANNIDLSQFKNWYDQAGTPEVFVTTKYNPVIQEYTLDFQQSCRPTKESSSKKPYVIPMKVGLISAKGESLPLGPNGETQKILTLTKFQQSFTFKYPTNGPIQNSSPPTLSLLRDFSAPVKLNFERNEKDLLLLMKYDSNLFQRWEAGQNFYLKKLQEALLLNDSDVEKDLSLDGHFLEAMTLNLKESSKDPLFFSKMLRLPSISYLEQFVNTIDPQQLVKVRETFISKLGEQLESAFIEVYTSHKTHGEYRFEDHGHRALRNLALSYLTHTSLPKEQYTSSNNMTDSLAALSLINNKDDSTRQWAMEDFYQKWHKDSIVANTWLRLHATSLAPGGLDRAKELMNSPVFDINTPNNVYNLLGGFAGSSLDFHRMDGRGYQFVADQIVTIDSQNPQVAARLASNYDKWRRYSPERQALIKSQLKKIQNTKGLSQNTFEIVSNSLL